MTQRGTSWPIPPPLKLLAKLPWRDQGVTCNDEQWQQFKQKIEPYIGSEGRWALPKQTLGSRIQALTLPNRTANTVRNYFGVQNPLAKDYVDLIQGACLTAAWFESAPELIRTEAIYQLINQLPGIERGKLRGWLGRSQVPIVGQRMALPATVTELHPALTSWLNQVTELPFMPRAGLAGGSAVEHQTQLSLICEQDEVHTAFSAVVIDTVQAPGDLVTLTQTLATIDQGNPTKPILLLLTVLAVFPDLQQFLDQCGHEVRVVLFSTDASLVTALGVAADNLAILSPALISQSQALTPAIVGTPEVTAPPPPAANKPTTPQEWIKNRVRERQTQSAVPYLELPRSAIDIPLAMPKLVITGAYGRGKRTLLRNLVAAINTQPNRAALVIDCRDSRLHLLFADIGSLLVYLLKPEDDPAVDADVIAEAITQMLSGGTLVPAFIYAESLPNGTATILAASLAGSAKRFYLTTRDVDRSVAIPFTKIAPVHRLEPISNTEQLALAASLRPELDRETVKALLVAAPSWMPETPLGLAVLLANPDKSKPALALIYATHCINQEGFTAHGTTLTKLACLLADFVQLKGHIDNKHADTWEAFIANAGLGLDANERAAQLARLHQCGIVTLIEAKVAFTHPDLEMMFAAYGWLMFPDRLKPNLELAAQWLGHMSAWEISDSLRAHLIDALPLPERAESLNAEHLLPVMDFLIATPEATLRQCQQLGQRLEKLAAALNTWKAPPAPLPRAGQFETFFNKIDQAARMRECATWIETHPLLLEHRTEQRRLADRAKAQRLIESCRDEIGTLCQRVIGDELTPLGSNANYKIYRDKIREVCQSFAAHHDDADIRKSFNALLSQFWKEWPTVILELLAIDDAVVLDTAITLYRRERRESARDFAEGRSLPLNELRYRRLPAFVMEHLRTISRHSNYGLSIQREAAEKLIAELATWA